MKKSLGVIAFSALAALFLSACSSPEAKQTASSSGSSTEKKETVTLTIAAAASLEYVFEEKLIPMFEKENPHLTVQGTYDSSGKLQTQIEERMPADIFMFAAEKQMTALVNQDLIEKDTVNDLLINKIVLIASPGAANQFKTFADITASQMIALGDPESVPVGQYSKEALENLGLWADIQDRVSFGTNVTEVLNWVTEGSADAGIVYATDAATTDKVIVVAEAPAGSLASDVIYPVGRISYSEHPAEAGLLLEFLDSKPARDIFAAYGFTVNQ